MGRRNDIRANSPAEKQNVTATPAPTAAKPKNMQWLYITFFLAACFPFSFGNIGPVADVLWIEWLTPPIFIVTLFKIINSSRSPVPIGGRLSAASILILAIWAFGHFLFHPVSSKTLLDAGGSAGGLRAYFQLSLCICIFFIAYWNAAYWQARETNWRTILRAALWVSLFIGFARLFTYFAGIELPLIKGVFSYDEGSAVLASAYRIGGLTECATLGLAALLALNVDRRWTITTYILLYVYLFLMVLGGGRSAMAGVLVALFVYFVVIRHELGKAIIFALVLLVGALVALELDLFARQFGRLSNVGGDFGKIQPERTMVYTEMWRIFLEHPVFGKGIGAQYVKKALPEFVFQQVTMGGHGAYLSVISLFGIAGILHLVANLFRPIWVGLKRLQGRGKARLQNPDSRMAAAFIVLALTILVFESTVGGNGYNLFRMYLYAGIMGGILARVHYER